MRAGSEGPAVADLHRRLRGFGLAIASEADLFGQQTEAALRLFQERRGLRVDGICGNETWGALVEAGYRLGDRLLYLRHPMLRGDDVVELQHQLGALGFHVGRADGIFGPDTQSATLAFQRNAGLLADATVGLQTISALRRLRSRGPAGDPAALRETARLREPASVLARHVAVGETGGLGALAREAQRELTRWFFTVTLLAHPDASELAGQANKAEASLYVGLRLAEEGTGCSAAYWGAHGTESPAGQRLARLVLEELSLCGAGIDGAPRAMNTPVLRETRMPAVVVEVGPARFAVERSTDVAHALAQGVTRWFDNPCTP